MSGCQNKLSSYPFLTGCTNYSFAIPILNYESGNFENYNIDFADLLCLIDTSGDTFVNLVTLSGNTFIIGLNNGVKFYTDLSQFDYSSEVIYLDGKIDSHTGDTNNPHQTSFYNLIATAHTHTISEITDFNDKYLTGGTYSGGFIYFSGNGTNFSVDVTALLDDTNTFTTGATLNGTILTLNRNDGVSYSVDLSSLNFTGNTSGTCISDLYVHNLGGCSPINILSEINAYDNIVPVSNSEFYFDVLTSTYSFGSIPNDGQQAYGMSVYGNKIYGVTNAGGIGYGTIYEYDVVTSAYTKLHTFTSSSTLGRYPSYPVSLDNNILYGIITSGGLGGFGLIYTFDLLTSSYSKLYDFTGGVNGRIPSSKPIVYNNNIYGTTQQGGVGNYGVIYQYDLTTSGYTVLYSFDGTNGGTPTGNFILYNDKIYGIATTDGPFGRGCLYEFDLNSSSYNVLEFFSASTVTIWSYTLSIGNNKIYGTTYAGNLLDYGSIFEYNLSTSGYTTLYEFGADSGADGYQPRAVTFYNNKLYGQTVAGGYLDGGVIYEFNTVTNTYKKLIDFATITVSPNGHILECNNNLYGGSLYGGDYSFGFLFRLEQTEYVSYPNIGSQPKPFNELFVSNLNLNGISITGISTNTDLVEYSDSTIATQRAVKDYVDNNDTFTTGATLVGTTLILTRNDSVDYSVDLSNLNFTGNTSATCISELYVHNLGGCSPINLLTDVNAVITSTNVIIGYDMTSGSSVLYSFTMAYRDPYCPLVGYDDKIYGTTSNGGLYNYGSLFYYDLITSGFTIIFEFKDTTTGTLPSGTHIIYNNKVYGTTMTGGVNDLGCIYEYDIITSAQTVLHSFDGTDGQYPQGTGSGVYEYNNNLYGVCSQGGSYSGGVLYSFDLSTLIFAKLYDFDGSIEGYRPRTNPIVYNSKLYGSTSLDSLYDGQGGLFEYDLIGSTLTFLTYFTYTGYGNGAVDLTAVNDKLFGATANGGANDLGCFFEYDLNTLTLTNLHDFTTIESAGNGNRKSYLNNEKIYSTCTSPVFGESARIYSFDITASTVNIEFVSDSANYGTDTYGLTLYKDRFYVATFLNGLNNDGAIFEYHDRSPIYETVYSTISIGKTTPVTNLYSNNLVLNPQTIPTASNDSYGEVGLFAWDDDYFYIKTNNGWARQTLFYGW